jgi:hypothetical protein
MKINSTGKITYLLIFTNLLFFSYYLILGYYTRPHYDDLRLMWILKDDTIIRYLKDYYFIVSGRFMFHGLNGLVFKTILFVGEYRYYPVLFWLVGAGICCIITNSVFKGISTIFIVNAGLFFYNLYVLTNIDFAVFNWLCAMSYYLLAPILLITLLLINQKKISYLGRIVLLIFSFFIGGGQEAFTPVVLVVLFFNALFYIRQHHFNIAAILKNEKVQRLILSATIIFVCFIIVIAAPGNYARLEGDRTSEGFQLPNSIFGCLTAYTEAIGTFLYFSAFYIPYYTLIGLCFCLIGSIYKKNEVKIFESITYKKLVIYSVIAYVIYLVCSVTPNVFLYSGFGIQRNYTHVVFFTMLFICFHAFLFGYYKMKHLWVNNLKRLLIAGIFIMCGIMVFNLYHDTISARTYASSVDKRIEMLSDLNQKGVKGIVKVDPITVPYTTDPKYTLYKLTKRKINPRPVLYYISDTDTIPNEYAFHLQKVYGFNFLIQLKKP